MGLPINSEIPVLRVRTKQKTVALSVFEAISKFQAEANRQPKTTVPQAAASAGKVGGIWLRKRFEQRVEQQAKIVRNTPD